MAWLQATPEKKKETRAQDYKRRYGEDCPELDLPDVGGCEHLVAYLFEVGPTVRGEELTHQDLRYWQENTGSELEEFEATMLVQMSRAFIVQYRASSKTCPRPWRRELTPEEKAERGRQQVAARKARQQQQQQKQKEK